MDHGIIVPRSQELVDYAVKFAIQAHGDQVRKYTGEPYVNHTIAVAKIVQKAGGNIHMICAAILHDVIEDTDVTYKELAKLEHGFNHPVARLVLQVSDVSRPEHGNRKVRKMIDRQFLAGADEWAQTIKYADMLNNGEDIAKNDPDFAKVYMAEIKELIMVMDKGDIGLRTEVFLMLKDYSDNNPPLTRRE